MANPLHINSRREAFCGALALSNGIDWVLDIEPIVDENRRKQPLDEEYCGDGEPPHRASESWEGAQLLTDGHKLQVFRHLTQASSAKLVQSSTAQLHCIVLYRTYLHVVCLTSFNSKH